MEQTVTDINDWPQIAFVAWENPPATQPEHRRLYAGFVLRVLHSPDRKKVIVIHDRKFENVLRQAWFWQGKPEELTPILEKAQPGKINRGSFMIMDFRNCAEFNPKQRYTLDELMRIPRNHSEILGVPQVRFLEVREVFAEFLGGK